MPKSDTQLICDCCSERKRVSWKLFLRMMYTQITDVASCMDRYSVSIWSDKLKKRKVIIVTAKMQLPCGRSCQTWPSLLYVVESKIGLMWMLVRGEGEGGHNWIICQIVLNMLSLLTSSGDGTSHCAAGQTSIKLATSFAKVLKLLVGFSVKLLNIYSNSD